MLFTERTVATIDDVVDGEALVNHPFLDRWAAGELTRDELRVWATQFHHHVEAFGRYVSTVHSHATDLAARRALLGLLNEVEGRSPSVADLWLQTCAALGLFSESVRASEPSSATEACMNDYFYLCQNSTVSGLAALYAFTRQLPALCKVQRDGFAKHYGMDSGPGVEFFEVCAYAASKQSRMLRTALEQAIHSEDTAREASGSAQAALTALRGLIAGVSGTVATTA